MTLSLPHLLPAGFALGTLPINSLFSIPVHEIRPTELAREGRLHHPLDLEYQVPAAYRAVAHALAHPDLVVVGFGALALYGLPVLVDDQDTVLAGPKIRINQPAGADRPALVRGTFDPDEVRTLLYLEEPVRVVSPGLAVVQALKLIKAGKVTWPVETVSDDPAFVRAVQLVDASRRFLNTTPSDILAAARERLDHRWLKKVLSASSSKADSPKETEMRLILQKVATKFGFQLEEQVPARLQGRLVTTLDAALMEPRYGYMYDGIHHWQKTQRVKDARINLDLTLLDVLPLRFATGTLSTIPAYTERLLRRDGFI